MNLYIYVPVYMYIYRYLVSLSGHISGLAGVAMQGDSLAAGMGMLWGPSCPLKHLQGRQHTFLETKGLALSCRWACTNKSPSKRDRNA